MARIKGIGFPFRKANGQFPALAEDDESLSESIEQIMLGGRFERPFRPKSGSNVMSLIFKNKGKSLDAMVVSETKRSLREQEKRIQVVSVAKALPTAGTESDKTEEYDVLYRWAGRAAKTRVPVDQGKL